MVLLMVAFSFLLLLPFNFQIGLNSVMHWKHELF